MVSRLLRIGHVLADLEGLTKRDWLLVTAAETDGQLKYYVHGKLTIAVGNQQVEVHDVEERTVWFQAIRDLESEGEIELLAKSAGSLTFSLACSHR